MKIEFNGDNPLGITGETPVNPLDIAETHEFYIKSNGLDYRERALGRCLDAGVQFNSTANNLRNMIRQHLTATCPYCSNQMSPATRSTGNSETGSFEFVCPKDNAKITITLPWNGMNICPKDPVE